MTTHATACATGKGKEGKGGKGKTKKQANVSKLKQRTMRKCVASTPFLGTSGKASGSAYFIRSSMWCII